MKLPISVRLAACAALVPAGARVADIGCDHGYLGISLLREGRAGEVFASDLREKPLQRARENARRFGLTERIHFLLADGLAAILPEAVDTIVIAGMGGDRIASILNAAPWVRSERYTLILQPQSSGNDLRRWLGAEGFSIEEERLVRDSGFLYAAMRVQWGGGRALTPAEQYCSPALLSSGSELLPEYLERLTAALGRTVQGLAAGSEPERLAYYSAALRGIREMRETV